MCHHAQRQHIIASLDALLYQLHTLSFFLSPSVLSFLGRLASQFQCSKPRELDTTASRSLRFFFSNILLFNASSIWQHATQGASEGRAVLLDFIAHVPSKIQLLSLDFLIVFLQLVLTTIAYEMSLPENDVDSNGINVLLSAPRSSRGSRQLPAGPILKGENNIQNKYTWSYVIDLQLSPIYDRLRNPPSSITNTRTTLPFPNTTRGVVTTISNPRDFTRRGEGNNADNFNQRD